MMGKRQANLNDPAFEPSLEDLKRLCRAAGDSVRAESETLARRKREHDSGRQQRKLATSNACEN